jgi:hypothetical protein
VGEGGSGRGREREEGVLGRIEEMHIGVKIEGKKAF